MNMGLLTFFKNSGSMVIRVTYTFSPVRPGWDVSGDKRVTSLDALMIMQAAASAIEL